ncbi:hypothetical protein [Nocardia iowensis]|uniref:Uncharacterized protein n=1 Tax=Nocardia iowensis TaxID=204891 RepID=A0ABX8RZ36_NOCIO|nr:hypothetical protein KV110_16220 [Nocardia iowensis]
MELDRRWGASRWGRELGPEGLIGYLQIQSVYRGLDPAERVGDVAIDADHAGAHAPRYGRASWRPVRRSRPVSRSAGSAQMVFNVPPSMM